MPTKRPFAVFVLALVVPALVACQQEGGATVPDGGGPGADAGDGIVQLIDEGDQPSFDTGAFPSVYVDEFDHLYVTYVSATDQGPVLRYATNASGRWEKMTVAPVGYNPQNSAITLQASNEPRICYTDSDQRLAYATLNQGEWTTSVLTDPGVFNVAIGVNSDPGQVHIVHYMLTGGDLGHAIQHDNGSWTLEPLVSPESNDGTLPALYVPGSGAIHVAYYRIWPEPEALLYGSYFDGNWQTQIIDPDDVDRCHIDLGRDGGGGLHVIYSCNPVRYARQDGAGWTVEVVDAVATDGALAVTTTGEAHACWLNREQLVPRLMYGYRAPAGWTAAPVPTSLAATGECRIALGRDNQFDWLHIVFQSGGALYHARLPVHYPGP